MDLLIDRWLHVMAGITWIGLLYYFNFIQVPSMAKIKEDGSATAITKFIAPRALLWFRWAALVTWLTGAYYLEKSGIGLGNAFLLKGTAAYIGLGVWLGTIMLFNVWVLIWPNQKKVLGMVEASDEAKLKAARIALLASRTNTMLSIPMLFFMVAGSTAHMSIMISF
ncbi:MAG: urate hydroxylase PuuD [Gammaproteobacteria bacterium]|nr:urate hydroxylase PuuD [Gammaproteobacteria bacterium]MDX2487826.1 urate hydroxylase PuuD [Gammaproteobacteria bacterium]